MWINRMLFQTVLDDNKALNNRNELLIGTCGALQAKHDDALAQRVKDNATIDWMRHRINALEKERTILLQRVAGIILPTPEIESSRAYELQATYDHLPSFEDVGDLEAQRLGLHHDDVGNLQST